MPPVHFIINPLSASPNTNTTIRRAILLLMTAALLAVFLVVFSPASGLFAAGGSIEVIETNEEVDFPGNVDLSVTAQGDDKIVEVRLFYRTVGSRVWAYAYPSFIPSNRITASLNLTGEVSSYLPPGTEVEYYYEITDSQGNILRTYATVVEYTDTRFDWDEVKIGPLTLQYYDQPASRVRSVAKSLEADLERLQRLLKLDQTNEIKGVIYARRSHTLDAFPQQSRTTTEQQIFQGFAFPSRSLFLGLGMDRGLIVHETTHLLLSQAMGNNAQLIPSWLDEGFASYMDPTVKVFSGGSLDSRTNPLRAMNTVTGTPHNIGSFYQKSLSVVAFMVNDFGEPSFQRFLGHLANGSTMDAALIEVYGFDVDGLDARWARESSGARAPAPSAPGGFNQQTERPDAILFFNSWLLGGLVLLVLALVSIQYVANKLRPAGDPEEGLQPWEDPDLWDDYDDEEDGPY
ncbi:MAG: peptidase MA family metallohydrolase [Dehalococcoidia bacterium]|nr:peptidase MA family metallohydrolase [Dehalococcoidia bacterium]